MRKNRKIAAAVGAVLLILIIMIAAAAIRNGYPLKAVYLEKEDGDGTEQIPEGTPVEVQENENGNPEFTAQPGCVYLVQGQWENGTVDYGFRVPAE